ncbi:hypothetical protein AVEN_60947-1 [Araneus ventricosus]|uniref:Uncharacterized protein n=1 Tax=Araneus ventricosus TaxID=182803 RepID=A0A4Y2DCY3_ARAVE|nr:hypothetical protein AVEN_60947-1 [Araneus ventricosus]
MGGFCESQTTFGIAPRIAAEVLQGIPADKLTDLTAIEKALETRFGDSHLMQFYRTELKTRRQKPGESLQVLAADLERLMSLAYAECPLDVRESLAAQHFFDAIRDEDAQLSTRLMDAKDLKSALAYSMKYEAARTVSKTSRHVRSIKTAHSVRPGEERDTDRGRGNSSVFSQSTAFKVVLRIGQKENYNTSKIRTSNLGSSRSSWTVQICVTDFPSQVSQKGVLVAATLVDLESKAIPARDNKPKILDKGAVIATYELVVDIVARPQEFSESLRLR